MPIGFGLKPPGLYYCMPNPPIGFKLVKSPGFCYYPTLPHIFSSSFCDVDCLNSRRVLSPDFKLFKSNRPLPSDHTSALLFGYQPLLCPAKLFYYC